MNGNGTTAAARSGASDTATAFGLIGILALTVVPLALRKVAAGHVLLQPGSGARLCNAICTADHLLLGRRGK